MERRTTFVSTLSRCEYLPDRLWQLRYEIRPEIDERDYMGLLRGGWRRIGPALFRPECPSCRSCQSLRVRVAAFRPNQSQRRAWKRNEGEVTIAIGTPSSSAEKLALFGRFHDYGHQAKAWPARDHTDLGLFIQNPFPVEEWSYRIGDRLVGVGYVDALPEGLSAVYFYHDPVERHRSLGTFNVMTLIAAARERGLPHVYLGYYVDGCRSLEYKARFRPNEVLRPDGAWTPLAFDGAE
jgi:arginine-tRNA-protein transferase